MFIRSKTTAKYYYRMHRKAKILQKQEGIPEKEIISIFLVCIRFILNMVQRANEEIILPILSMLKKSMDKMKKFDMI